jgi:hypothetical protein
MDTQDHGLDVVERAVRAVDARDTHTGRVQAREGLLITSLWADRADETSFFGAIEQGSSDPSLKRRLFPRTGLIFSA